MANRARPKANHSLRLQCGTAKGRAFPKPSHEVSPGEALLAHANGSLRFPLSNQMDRQLHDSGEGGAYLLIFLVLASCALLTAVLALALLREIRLRKALEALWHKLLSTWRR